MTGVSLGAVCGIAGLLSAIFVGRYVVPVALKALGVPAEIFFAAAVCLYASIFSFSAVGLYFLCVVVFGVVPVSDLESDTRPAVGGISDRSRVGGRDLGPHESTFAPPKDVEPEGRRPIVLLPGWSALGEAEVAYQDIMSHTGDLPTLDQCIDLGKRLAAKRALGEKFRLGETTPQIWCTDGGKVGICRRDKRVGDRWTFLPDQRMGAFAIVRTRVIE